MTAMSVMGVDGGGSKTLIALADASGTVTRLVGGGGINPIDNPLWLDDFGALFKSFGCDPAVVARGVAAMPAYGEIDDLPKAQDKGLDALFGSVPHRVVNDVDAAHFGAFAGGAGILMLSGTGSMVWARDESGTPSRVGGWGGAFGDEGSAYWIGLRAVTLTSRALDGRIDALVLVEAVFGFLGLDRSRPQDGLMGWHAGLRHPRAEIAALAVVVDHLAAEGDPTALAILDEAAGHLAAHVFAISRRWGTAAPVWSYAGGTFASRILLDALSQKIGTPPRRPVLPPIGGALLRAAKDLDWPVDQAWIGRLAASIANNAPSTRGPAEPVNKPREQSHA
jgi:glucosamine kinase